MCKAMNSLVRVFQDEETSVQDKYMIGKALIELIENALPKDEVMKLAEGTYENADCGKKLIISSAQKSTLDNRKIAEELTIEELKLTYSASATKLKAIGKGDLAEKYKTVTIEKSAKVMKL